MLLPTSLRFTLILTLVALPLSCGSSGTSGASSGAGSSDDDIQVNFSGPQASSPISSTKVVISWLDASNTAGDPPSSIIYRVYRSTALDLSDETLVGTTSPGITSFVDDGLSDKGNQTYFYRVVAEDVFGNDLNLSDDEIDGILDEGVSEGICSLEQAEEVKEKFRRSWGYEGGP